MQRGLSVVEGEPLAPGLEFPELDKYTYRGKGKYEVMFRNESHLMNVSGICYFSHYVLPWGFLYEFMSTVTGWDFGEEEGNKTAERVAAMRQMINIREGLHPRDFKLPGRVVGNPPFSEGPTANISVDADTLCQEYLREMRWDETTGRPERQRLVELGLDDVAQELYGRY